MHGAVVAPQDPWRNSKEFKENYSNSNKTPKYGFGALHRPLYWSRTPEMDLKGPTE